MTLNALMQTGADTLYILLALGYLFFLYRVNKLLNLS